jgi:glycosyltransferase involved in cell wall biosynthesis
MAPTPQEHPLVSVVVPAWNSTGTLARCLEALRGQRYPRVEVIVVDSSPLEQGQPDPAAAIVAGVLPAARYIHLPQRATPHTARNVGAAHAHGALFAFTDPDIYPHPDWLDALASVYRARGGAVVGTLACYGNRWLDHGAHFTKFHLGLAPKARGHRIGAIPRGWSGNFLVDRATFYAAGGWPGSSFQGDTEFTAHLVRRGVPLWLAPDAVVEHDHEAVTLRAFLRERFVRGREYARLEATGATGGAPWTRRHLARQGAGIAALPVKVALSSARVVRDAQAAGRLGRALATLPVIVAGRAAWLGGRALGTLALLGTG